MLSDVVCARREELDEFGFRDFVCGFGQPEKCCYVRCLGGETCMVLVVTQFNYLSNQNGQCDFFDAG
jgi:hypothetical protein